MLPAVLRDALEAARARAARRAAARQRRQKGRAGGGGRGGADAGGAGDPEAGEDEDDEDLEFEHSDLVRAPPEGFASWWLEGGTMCQEGHQGGLRTACACVYMMHCLQPKGPRDVLQPRCGLK